MPAAVEMSKLIFGVIHNALLCMATRAWSRCYMILGQLRLLDIFRTQVVRLALTKK